MRDTWLPAALVAAIITAMAYVLYADLSPRTNSQSTEQFQQERPGTYQQGAENRGFFDVTLADIATLVLVGSTVGLWIATRKLWKSSETHAVHMEESVKAAKDAVHAATEANQLARNQFMVSVRPWIAVMEINPSEDIYYDGAGCTIGLFVSVKNVGHSPAMNVHVHARVFPRLLQPSELVAAKEDILQTSNNPFRWGDVLFPDQPPLTLSIRRRLAREAMQMEPGTTACIITPLVIGCVSYRFAVADPAVHRTWFASVVGIGPVPEGVSPGQIQCRDLNASLLLVLRGRVQLSPYTIGGWTAD